jgi:hypothetical protein
VDHVLEVTLREIREAPRPPAKNEDVEPLDNEADNGDEPVYPGHDPDGNPVYNPDKEFYPPCVMLVEKKL